MKNERNNIYLLIPLYLGLIFVFSICFKKSDSIQTFAVVLTGAIIIWYTIETKILRLETQKLTEIQIRPFVIFEIKGESFILRNIGHGPALNIQIRPINVSSNESIQIRFNDLITSIETNESVEIKGESFRKGKSAGDFFLAHLDPEYANRNLSIFIDYQNIDLKKYTTRERISPQKRRIVDFGPK